MKRKPSLIRLGVNIDHCATLRQVRGGTTPYPDLLKIARQVVKAGAEQITIHLREDRRHIQDHDLRDLARQRLVPLNLEMAATTAMVRKALRHKPDWVCLVPEKREELTTEGGLDVARGVKRMRPLIARMQRIGIEVSLFIEPSLEQVQAAFEVGGDAVEFHTGHWVMLKGARRKKEWRRLVAAAELAHDLGLGVHAGHGLEPTSTREIRKLPHLREVNIGHWIVCDAIENGIESSVRQLRQILRARR